MEKTKLLTEQVPKKHEIELDGETFEVWVKDLTFLDIQKAAQSLLKGDGFNLSAYWRYAFENWILKTNPELSLGELLLLNPEAGQSITALLPAPGEMIEMLGFSKAGLNQ
jgi:hypothetical protein